MLIRSFTALLIAALQVSSCQAPGATCTSTAECGATQACLKERCREVECRASGDCGIEAFCNLETYTCDAGCATSDDCLVGDRCDVPTSTCVARACTETQLDCDLGERCNPATARCEEDPEPYCKRCSSDQECGPTGVCGRVTMSGQPRCFLTCSPESFDPCPAGLQCSFQQTPDGQDDGFRCVGLCDRL